jgi:hypothetical protein
MPEKTGRLQGLPRRSSRGRFQPGASGNPAGRPKGSRNKITALCADLLGDDAGEIMRKLIERAKRGDPVALRLCVERLIPARAARDRSVELAELPEAARAVDLVAGAAAVIRHAAAGDITLSEAREFMQLLEGQRRVIETAALAVRLEALEGPGAAPAPAPAAPADPNYLARVRRLQR